MGKNCIFTKSSIYQFDSYYNPIGNTWSMEHGNIGKTRRLNFNYNFSSNEKKVLNRAYCYPNPIRNDLGIIRVETLESTNIDVTIYDLAGYYIQSFNSQMIPGGLQVQEWEWNTNNIESGIYFAHISVSSSEKVETQIIKIALIQ